MCEEMEERKKERGFQSLIILCIATYPTGYSNSDTLVNTAPWCGTTLNGKIKVLSQDQKKTDGDGGWRREKMGICMTMNYKLDSSLDK